MRGRITFGAMLGCLLVGSLILAGSVQAKSGGVSCHKINARAVGQDLGGGQTQGRIIGGGLLHGTTIGNFVVSGSLPVFSLAGTVEITANRATLTVTVVGSFNVASGAFTASGPVSAATGKLAGASGALMFTGVEDLADGSFVEDVNGDICVALAP